MRYFPALLLLVAANCSAAWFEGETDDGILYAATTNDDGQLLAQYCDVSNGTCQWVMITEIGCDVGKTQTPTLVAAPAGGISTTLACLSKFVTAGKTFHKFGFYPFDSVDTAFRQTGTVGIAFPMETGQFRVVRFSLSGGAGVIDAMRAKAVVKSQVSTKGQTL
jgi:hypothetical protein